MTKTEVAYAIAKEVSAMGGRAFFVGGFVRDKLNNKESDDIDVEVYGVPREVLLRLLCRFGKVNTIGYDFGVFHLEDFEMDVAVPRREKTVGKGHRDIEITVDENMSFSEATSRRDFTVNAMLMDVLSGEVIDVHGGIDDLKKKTLRHVDDSFVCDPLRLLRAVQFSARLDYKIDERTVELCRKMDITSLSKERVLGETKKALLKAEKPSLFFYNLREMGKLGFWFAELDKLTGLRQDGIYHPEGDVFTHTMEVIDRGAKYRDKAKNPFYFMMLCLTHDFGKIVSTTFDGDRVHSYNHENEGFELVERFVKRICNGKGLIRYLKNMIPLHMKPNVTVVDKSRVKETNKMFDKAICPVDLIYFALSDKELEGEDALGFLTGRYGEYKSVMSEPYVSGKDLTENGITDKYKIKEYLLYAHKMRLSGERKENVLRQILAKDRS